MTTLDVDAIRQLYKHHLVSGKRIPLTVCPSWKLLEGLIRSYDENGDNTLMGDEKAELLTTLATNPEIAIYRYLYDSNCYNRQSISACLHSRRLA